MGEALKLRPLNNAETCNELTFGVIYKKILQNDCLRNGWVLYGYPNKLEYLRYLFEESNIQPNKVFFLHCPRNVALHRIEKRLLKTKNNIGPELKTLECIARSFDSEKNKILKFLQTNCNVFHINGNHRAFTVRNEIFDKFVKERHSIGFL